MPIEDLRVPSPGSEPIAPEVPAPSDIESPPVIIPKSRRKLPLLIACTLLVLLAVAIGVIIYAKHDKVPVLAPELHPYFEYSAADIDRLKNLKPAGKMTVEDSWNWQDKTYTLIEEHSTGDVDASKVYTYLSVAQLDAAMLTYSAHGEFSGNLDTVSKDVLCEFYKDSCSGLDADEDVYSRQLADIVLAKVKQRISDDDKNTRPSALKTGTQYWQGPEPQIGILAATFKPWLTKSNSQFRPTAPAEAGSKSQQEQLATVKQMLGAATNEQKAIVVKWAGGPGTKTPPGIWLTLVDDYMRGQKLPLERYLQIRAVTSMAMSDAVGATFDGKYHFQYKRPGMFDRSIITVMPTPNHPAYPSGHSTISASAAAVLSHYLPEHQQEWNRLAIEAGYSRVVGGIHFPMDDEAGLTLGKNVGNEAAKNW